MAGPFVDGRRRSALLPSDPEVVSHSASLFLAAAAVQIANGVRGAMPGVGRAPCLEHRAGGLVMCLQMRASAPNLF